MRMWKIDVTKMCRKHLLAEHLELHMFVGAIKKKKNLKGYLEGNLLEPKLIYKRHDEIVLEMLKRGYKHKSELDKNEIINQFIEKYKHITIDKNKSLNDLRQKCSFCNLEK